MKTVIWVSALSVVICIGSAVTLWRMFYYPDSNPWLREFPVEAETQVMEINNLERLRDVTLYLLHTDYKEKQLTNVTLQNMVKLVVGLLTVLASLAGCSLQAAWRTVRAQPEMPVGKLTGPPT